MRLKKTNNKGFTLIEILVAVSMLMIAMSATNSSWSGSVLALKKTSHNNNIAQLLERKMIEMETLYSKETFDSIPKELSGDFGEDFSNYSWTMKSQEFEMPDLTRIALAKDGEADEVTITIMNQMKEFMTKSVLEVVVSVTVTIDKKPYTHSISNYFVNYDQDLNIPGLSL